MRVHKIKASICMDKNSIKLIERDGIELFVPKFIMSCEDKIELSVSVFKSNKRKSWANGVTEEVKK